VIHNFDTVLFVNVIFPYFLSSSSFSSGFSANFNKLKALALELGVCSVLSGFSHVSANS